MICSSSSSSDSVPESCNSLLLVVPVLFSDSLLLLRLPGVASSKLPALRCPPRPVSSSWCSFWESAPISFTRLCIFALRSLPVFWNGTRLMRESQSHRHTGQLSSLGRKRCFHFITKMVGLWVSNSPFFPCNYCINLQWKDVIGCRRGLQFCVVVWLFVCSGCPYPSLSANWQNSMDDEMRRWERDEV